MVRIHHGPPYLQWITPQAQAGSPNCVDGVKPWMSFRADDPLSKRPIAGVKVRAMSIRAILLRVLLSVSLVLNGATGAAAAVRMQMPHDDGQAFAALAAESPESASGEMPCHQQATGTSDNAPLPAADPQPATSKHSTPDCCKSSGCNCACVQAAQTPLASMFIHAALVDHSRSVSPVLPGHPSPALPHLIRPPIG